MAPEDAILKGARRSAPAAWQRKRQRMGRRCLEDACREEETSSSRRDHSAKPAAVAVTDLWRRGVEMLGAELATTWRRYPLAIGFAQSSTCSVVHGHSGGSFVSPVSARNHYPATRSTRWSRGSIKALCARHSVHSGWPRIWARGAEKRNVAGLAGGRPPHSFCRNPLTSLSCRHDNRSARTGARD